MLLADDDPDRVCTSSPQLPIRNMVFDAKKDEIRGRGANKKLSRRNMYRNETQEDGAVDVVIDGKSEEPLKLFDSGNTSPRPVNRKDEEEQNSHLDVESPSVASGKSYKFEKMENRGMVSVESSDSNLSESSAGSFSFPMRLIGLSIEL
ncbi:hypothetical protein GH714_043270 [Hevea brasiliensis]|uniref:Uncharacterized protein n=1 Tax=Hevea brasiliensis TaxID=3981 RepID=A0A6A6K3S9_HEVBR|nr:hypothetical protein GH714_043270 [Hevea brasiliensis]